MAKNLGGDLPYRKSLIGEPFDLSSLRGRRLRTWSSSSHTLTYRLEPAQRGETARFPLAGAILSRCLVSKLARKTAADFADASEVVARGRGREIVKMETPYPLRSSAYGSLTNRGRVQ
jgi:hypothetical protein